MAGLLKVIEEKVGRKSDMDKFATMCLFDSLIGNHDRHGRNLALIETTNDMILAPLYDNPSYIGIEIPELLEAFHEPRGAIPTKFTREPTMKDYVRELHQMKFDHVIKEFMDRITLSRVESLIRSSFICKQRQEALFAIIKRRYQELEDAIAK